jgi:hypothetical protein
MRETERRSARRRCVPVGVGTPVAALDAARDELPELLEAWRDDLLAIGPLYAGRIRAVTIDIDGASPTTAARARRASARDNVV